MKFQENKIKLQKIYLENQDTINLQNIINAMYTCYNNVKFTTFSYKKSHKNDSQKVLSLYSCGNCISFAYFVKKYLMENFNAKSYIICASVPNVNKIENTPNACHCALLVPLNFKEFAIIDCAFYFEKPMICRIDNQKDSHNVYMCDVYSNTKINIDYKLEYCKQRIIDENYNQILLPDTMCVHCKYSDNNEQNWNYYLNEVTNPDESIGSHYLNNVNKEFLLYTIFDPTMNQVTLKSKISLIDGNYIIKKYPSQEVTSYNEKNELYDELKDNHELYFIIKKLI